MLVELANSIQCCVGYNKGNTKVKFESEFFSGLCFMTVVYIKRVSEYNKRKGKKIELNVDIPLEEFFTIMKDHHEYRGKIKQKF